jgi:hypothetical protein
LTLQAFYSIICTVEGFLFLTHRKALMKKALITVSLAVSLTACSNMSTLQTENIEKKQVPTWYLEHADQGKEGWLWDRQGMFYAVAEDVSPSMEMAVKKATLKAKAKIVDRVNGEMNNRTTLIHNEAGSPDAPVGNTEAQDVIVNLIAESVLRTYGLEKKMVIWNPELRNYRAFVLMKINKKDVETMAAKYDQNKQVKLQNRVAGKTVDETAAEVLNQTRK